MAIQTRTILPTSRRSDFSQTWAGVAVPANLVAATFRMVSTEFTDPALTVHMEMEESHDGGVTWQFTASGDYTGGLIKNGQLLLPSMRVTFNGLATHVRGTIATVGTWRWGLVADLET